jgi:hypothetical protein
VSPPPRSERRQAHGPRLLKPRLAFCRYASIAAAFKTPLEYHEETKRRMYEMGKHRYKMDEQTEEQKQARDRMALFPKDAEVLFVQEDL